MQFQVPKGTYDILPCGEVEPWMNSGLWQLVEGTARDICRDYGYKEIRTPIYERTELFDRGIGETTDIVSKEMFTFLDKGGRSISLRPEGTAAVMRSFIENQLNQHGSSHKLFYIAPMFRYERPQAGRYRQHHQFGIEAIGVLGPEQDAEVIDLLCEFLRRLGLKNFKAQINTLGDKESRESFRQALIDFLRPHFTDLSEDSQIRFEKNPLRILDSKDPKDQEILQKAPSILTHLTPESKAHFQTVCKLLDSTQVPYIINDRIIRGLDYYTKTVFEIIVDDSALKVSLGGGGRYDGLLKTFGGPDLPSCGFGSGLERILQTMLHQKAHTELGKGPFLTFIPLGDEARELCFSLATALRHDQIPTEIDLLSKKLPTAFQQADRQRAAYAAILGTEEMKKEKIQWKNLATREQREISLAHFLEEVRSLWKLSR